jgi:hypothetical protein
MSNPSYEFGTTGNFISFFDNEKIITGVSGDQILTIDGSNSRVGIGTTEPSGTVSIFASSLPSLKFNNNNTGNSSSTGALISLATNGDLDFGTLGANDIKFYTDFTQRMEINENGDVFIDTDTLYVDSSGDKVGINTAIPGQALDVNGNANISGSLLVDLNTLIVDSSSSTVGIGTLVPSEKLHILESQNEDTRILVANNTSDTAAESSIRIQSSGGAAEWHTYSTGFTTDNFNIADGVHLFSGGGSAGGFAIGTQHANCDLIFYTGANDTNNEAMRIDSSTQDISINNNLYVNSNTFVVDSTNNKVGIGITDPEFLLDVYDSSTDTGVYFRVGEDANPSIRISHDNSASEYLYLQQNSGGDAFIYNNTANNLNLGTDNTTHMQINGTGHITVENTIYGNNAYLFKQTGSTQSIPNATFTAVIFGTINNEIDLNDDFTVTSTSLITIDKDGLFMITYNVKFDNNATGTRYGFISINSDTTERYGYMFVHANENADISINGTAILPLSDGDTVEIIVAQSSGGNLNISGSNNNRSFLYLYKLGNT